MASSPYFTMAEAGSMLTPRPLGKLALEKETGVRSVPQVEEGWFERFTA